MSWFGTKKSVAISFIIQAMLASVAFADQWSIGYWSPFGNPACPISELQWEGLTHVVHHSALVNPDGTLDLTTEEFSSHAFELVWQVHAAAFALALPTLGTIFIGAALATHANGLTPAWQRLLGLVGGSLLLAAGLGNLAIADGSALIFVGLLGFAAWLVWLLATGVRLVRS